MFFDPIQIDDLRVDSQCVSKSPSPNPADSATLQRFFPHRFGIRRPKFTSLFIAKTPTFSQKSVGFKSYSIKEMQFRTLLHPIALRTVPILLEAFGYMKLFGGELSEITKLIRSLQGIPFLTCWMENIV
jgi:hypothetical protein